MPKIEGSSAATSTAHSSDQNTAHTGPPDAPRIPPQPPKEGVGFTAEGVEAANAQRHARTENTADHLSEIENDLLLSMTEMMSTPAVANLSATSHAMHEKLAAEVERRPVVECTAAWARKAARLAPKIDACAAAAVANGWTTSTLSEMTSHLLDLGLFPLAEEFARALLRQLPRTRTYDFAAAQAMLIRALLMQKGKAAEAGLVAESVLENLRGQKAFLLFKAKAEILAGEFTAARETLRKYDGPVQGQQPERRRLVEAMWLHSTGNVIQARNLTLSVAGRAEAYNLREHAAEVAEAYAWIGETRHAMEWVVKSVRAFEVSASLPDPLRNDGAFLPLSPFAAIEDLDHENWTELKKRASDFVAGLQLPQWPALP